MQGIKNIIFDLGGVIINLDNKLTEDAFVAMGVKNFRDYFGHGFAVSVFKDYEVGKVSDQQFIDEVRKLTGLEATDAEILHAWNALLLDFPPERIQLLNDLRNKYRLFLFSNTNALHLEYLQGIYTDSFGGSLDDHFEKAYYSHLLGKRKPDKSSYQQILLENGLKGEETLFVDDALVNVEGANAAGLRGYFLKPGMSILDIPI